MVVVDPDGAVTQPAHDALGFAGIGGKYCAGQTVDGVVGDLQGFVFIAESLDGHDRAEGFVVDEIHVGVAVDAVDDRRQVIKACAQIRLPRAVLAVGVLAGGSASAREDLRAVLAGFVYITRDFFAVLGGNQRAGFSLIIGGSAEFNVVGALGKFFDEFIVQ